MTQIFTGTGLGTHGSSLSQLGSYGPKGAAGLGQGGGSVYVNGANGNLVIKQSDGFLNDLGVSLDLFQSYNSKASSGGAWRFNLETRLIVEGAVNTAGSIVRRIDEDGHESLFRFDALRQRYLAEDGSTASLLYYQNTWQYSEGSGERRCLYNTAGQLTQLTDRDGHALRVVYQDGHLAMISDESNKQTVNWHFAQGLLQEVTIISEDQVVQRISYSYDHLNRLSRIGRSLGEGKTYWISYGYEGDSQLINSITQSDGSSLQIEYDKEGRVKKLVDGENRITTYTYLDHKTVVTNGLSEAWTYSYDEKARLIGLDGPENFHARYAYEGNQLQSITQGNQRWQFRYNETGDCIRIDYPSGEVETYSYDNEHHLLGKTRYQAFDGNHAPLNPQTTHFVYDASGHLRFEVSPDGTVKEYRYDKNGLLSSSRCYLKAAFNQPCSLETLSQWSALQNPQQISLTAYHYDWRGALTETLHYTKINEQGEGVYTADTQIAYSRYDAAGHLVEKSVPTDTGLSTTHYFYDGLNRLIRTIDNQGHTQTFDYDDAGHRLIKTDLSGLQTLYTYDLSGLLLASQQLQSGNNFGTTTYRYDEASRLIAKTSVDGKSDYYFYDTQGRLIGEINANGQAREYQYDENGHCIKTIAFAATSRLTDSQKTLPAWSSIRPITSGNDRVSQVIYNNLQQIAFEVNAEGAVIAYQYDAENRLIAKKAYATKLPLNALEKNLTLADIKINPGNEDRTVSYYYDREGLLQGEINGEGAVIAYRYDREGHLIELHRYVTLQQGPRTGDWLKDTPKEDLSADSRTHTLYNAAGLKIASIDACGYLTEYRYDQRGLLIESIAYYTPIQWRESATLETIRPIPHTNDHHSQYRYNDLNELIEETNQSGLITTYTYNAQGLVTSKTNTDRKTQEARSTRYRYDALGRLIQSLDAEGSHQLNQSVHLNDSDIEKIWDEYSTHFKYDEAGRLLSKTNAEKQATHYYYNETGLLTYTLSPTGAITETRYNAFEQIDTVIQYSARWLQPAIPSQSQLQQYIKGIADKKTDEITHYDYNHLGLMERKSRGEGSETISRYNAFGELEQTIQTFNPTQSTIKRYQYDQQGLLRFQIADEGGINQTLEWQYNGLGFLQKSWDARRQESRYLQNLRGETIAVFDPMQGQKLMTYDAFGRLLSVEDQHQLQYTYDDQQNTLTLKRPGIKGSIVTQFSALGDKISVTDANNNVFNYQYDAKGQLIHINAPEGTSNTYRYDREGHLLYEENGERQAIRYYYNGEGALVRKIIDPEGLSLTTSYTYDGIGRQLRIDSNGQCTQFSYDAEGNLIRKVQDPEGLALTTEFSYTKTGQLSRQTTYNPQGVNQVTAYQWDALGRCIATQIDPDGLNLETRFEYDKAGNCIAKIDANQNRIQFIYDSANRLHYSIDALGGITAHEYDKDSNEIVTIRFAHRLNPGATYDETSIKASLIKDDKADQYQFFYYDAQSRLARSYDALGYVTYYTYDANDNCLSVEKFAAPCSLDELKQGQWPRFHADEHDRGDYYSYDGLNRLRFEIDFAGTTTEYTYDKSSQLIAKTRYATLMDHLIPDSHYNAEAITKNLRRDALKDEASHYRYDKAGRLITQQSPTGIMTGFTYNDAGQMTSTTLYAIPSPDIDSIQKSQDDRTTHFVFDAAGREVYRVSPTGLVVERRYDNAGNVLTETTYAQAIQLESYTQKAIKSALQASASQTTAYRYDGSGRLAQKTDALNHSTQYTYDKDGNVTSETNALGACWTYSYNKLNQLIETHSPITTVALNRDGVISEERRPIITQNDYDAFGNLISTCADSGGLNRLTYFRYDLKNQKIETIYPDQTVNIASWNQSKTREETEVTLTESLQYNAFGEVLASKDKAGNWQHYAYNSSGNLTFSVDALNHVARYDYDAFGNVIAKTTYAATLPPIDQYEPRIIVEALPPSQSDRHETYLYDKDNRLIETQKDIQRLYDSSNSKYYQLKPITKTTYNAFGEINRVDVKRTDEDWSIVRTYYNQEGLKRAFIDAEGYLTTYTYNAYCQLSGETQYTTRATAISDTGFKPPIADVNDRTYRFETDALGRLLSKTQTNVSTQRLINGTEWETMTRDLTSRYAYDALGNLIMTEDTEGNTAYHYYNEIGQLVAKVGIKTRQGRAATTYRYNAEGALLESRQWANGVSEADLVHFRLNGESTSDIIRQDIYDASGHLIEQIDGSGHSLYFSYDAKGNMARSWQVIKQVDGSEVIVDRRYQYDALNHLLQTITIKKDNTWASTESRYNAFGEVVAEGHDYQWEIQIDYDTAGRVWRSNAQGFFQIYIYDLCDQITQVITSSNCYEGSDISTPIFEQYIDFTNDYRVNRQDNLYDKAGRLIAQTRELGMKNSDREKKLEIKRACQTQTVDRWGNVLSHTNANGFTTLYEYNGLDKVIKQTLPAVSAVDERGQSKTIAPEIHYAYDGLGRLLGTRDANGNTQAKLLDAEGRITEEFDAYGVSRKKEYNLLGQITKSTNELGGVTLYTYDKENRLLSVINQTTTKTYAYDEAGQLIQQQDGTGNTLRYWHNELSHLTRKEEHAQSTYYEYDNAGHKTRERDANGNSQLWTYDKQGCIKEHSDLGNHLTTYSYNSNGELIKEQSSNGRNVDYFHLSDGLLDYFIDNAGLEEGSYTYDAEGQLKSRLSQKKDSWIKEEDLYEYDALGRLVSMKRYNPNQSGGAQELLDLRYEYDAAGNIRSAEESVQYPQSNRVSQRDYFKYDANNRMLVNKGAIYNGEIAATLTQGTAMAYDKAGNISVACKFENGGFQWYEYLYNSDNFLETIRLNHKDFQTRRYDKAGNVIEENLYDTNGLKTQKNEIIYYQGQMIDFHAKDIRNLMELSHSHYSYDNVGNLTNILTIAPNAYKQTHVISYALWEGYQQSSDVVTTEPQSQAAYQTINKREYNSSGQLTSVIEQQLGGIYNYVQINYSTSVVEGLHSAIDSNSETHYITIGGKTIGDVRVENKGSTRIDVYAGFTPIGTPPQTVTLWNPDTKPMKEGELYYSRTISEGILPNAPQDNIGTYTIKAGDTLERIALQVYGDAGLWYLIADANGITDRNSSMHVGMRLNIPATAKSAHYTSGTSMQATDWAADKTDNLPAAAPVRKKHHSPWKLLASIVVAVVATYATIMSAGALGFLIAGTSKAITFGALLSNGIAVLGGSAGLLSSGAIGFAAGFIGSVAGQGMANLTGLQSHVDLKSALFTGLVSGATASITSLLRASPLYQKIADTMKTHSPALLDIQSATEMLERDAISQAINLSNGQKHIDWLELAVSSASAGFMGSQYGLKLADDLQKTFKKLSTTVSTELQSFTTNALKATLTGGHFNAAQVLTDSLGGAVANNLTQLTTPEPEVIESKQEAEVREEETEDWLARLDFSEDLKKAKERIAAWEAANAFSDYDNSLMEAIYPNQTQKTVDDLTKDLDFTGDLEDSKLSIKIMQDSLRLAELNQILNAEIDPRPQGAMSYKQELSGLHCGIYEENRCYFETKQFKNKEEVWLTLNEEYGTSIDFSLPASYEGGQQLKGYLPIYKKTKKVIGKSGITIATGFDVGQYSKQQIKSFKFPKDLEEKVMLFAGVKGEAAKNLLPLVDKNMITTDQANLIDYKVKSYHLESAINRWDNHKPSNTPSFAELTPGQQTVLFSRTFHQGPGMPDLQLAQQFYQAAINNKWNQAEMYLRNYNVKDNFYVDRVNAEANVLRREKRPK